YDHIFNQGNNRQNIFFEPRNYSYFLGLLKKYITPIAEVYAYCLLPNHFHLLVRINDECTVPQGAQAFSNLFNAYAKGINKAYQRTGSLIKRKFSRIKIESEAYLKKLVLYIHTNAQHHNIVDDFKTYPHSSYNIYFSQLHTNISRVFMLNLFDSLDNFSVCHSIKSTQIDEKLNQFLLE
ncbi:MAG: transposase, partial [Maribacter sp.]